MANKETKVVSANVVSKVISAGYTEEKVNLKTGAVTKAKAWPAGTLVFNSDLSGYTREDLELIAKNAIKHHMQYGVSTLWRNNAGNLKAKAYGEFSVSAAGEFYYTKGFEKGQAISKKAREEAERAQAEAEAKAKRLEDTIANVEKFSGRKLTEEEIAILAKDL